jgi:diguanylate cyclase (GGDEF)-like protein
MPPTVLLIDDSEAVHHLVRGELAADGVDMLGAFDGMAGLRVAKERHPDLILLDVGMPGMDGFEACELLAVQPETATTPVVFLSGAGEAADRVRGLNCGATDYIAKPFVGDELRARVRVSLRYKALVEMEARRAMRDGLTGLWNRKYLDERLAADSATAARHRVPLSCVMFDLDHFKTLNDAHGHAAGDAALRAVAAVLHHGCRREDVACRYGGEEFAVLCPGVPAAGAAGLAERLRAAVAAAAFDGPDGPLRVTGSFGVACGPLGADLLQAADEALYRAKDGGRNRVVIAG